MLKKNGMEVLILTIYRNASYCTEKEKMLRNDDVAWWIYLEKDDDAAQPQTWKVRFCDLLKSLIVKKKRRRLTLTWYAVQTFNVLENEKKRVNDNSTVQHRSQNSHSNIPITTFIRSSLSLCSGSFLSLLLCLITPTFCAAGMVAHETKRCLVSIILECTSPFLEEYFSFFARRWEHCTPYSENCLFWWYTSDAINNGHLVKMKLLLTWDADIDTGLCLGSYRKSSHTCRRIWTNKSH